MNVDRCIHVPTSPGQLCTCLDTRMWLRFLVEILTEALLDAYGLDPAVTPIVWRRDAGGRLRPVPAVSPEASRGD